MIPNPRLFLNAQNVPIQNIRSRLKGLDSGCYTEEFQQSDGGVIVNYVLVWSFSLTSLQIQNSLSLSQTQAEIDALTRQYAARVGALSISQLNNATPSQIEAYITTQITNNVAQATALNAITNISTTNVTAAVNSIRPILTGLVNAQYATKDLLILIGKILVYIRDEIFPN